jgi:hypothetical protein
MAIAYVSVSTSRASLFPIRFLPSTYSHNPTFAIYSYTSTPTWTNGYASSRYVICQSLLCHSHMYISSGTSRTSLSTIRSSHPYFSTYTCPPSYSSSPSPSWTKDMSTQGKWFIKYFHCDLICILQQPLEPPFPPSASSFPHFHTSVHPQIHHPTLLHPLIHGQMDTPAQAK